MKETEITIKVKLDDNNIPEQILWSAPDGGMKISHRKPSYSPFGIVKRKRL